MILIYARARDQFVNDVIDWIKSAGEACVKISNEAYFEVDGFNLPIKGEVCLKFSTLYESVANLQRVKSIWFYGGNSFNKSLTDRDNLTQKLLLDGVLSSIRVRKIGGVNNVFPNSKIVDLGIARSLGLNIPDTLVTRSKLDLLNFYNKYRKDGVISKRVMDGGVVESEDYIHDISKTIIVDDEKISKLPERFGLSLFQKQISKEYEIRIIYINGLIFSAAIFDTSVDYRQNLLKESDSPRIIPYTLPPQISSKIEKLMKALNYTFASIDMIKGFDDFYFLEINPAGQISYINGRCNFYLEKLVAKFLCNE